MFSNRVLRSSLYSNTECLSGLLFFIIHLQIEILGFPAVYVLILFGVHWNLILKKADDWGVIFDSRGHQYHTRCQLLTKVFQHLTFMDTIFSALETVEITALAVNSHFSVEYQQIFDAKAKWYLCGLLNLPCMLWFAIQCTVNVLLSGAYWWDILSSPKIMVCSCSEFFFSLV